MDPSFVRSLARRFAAGAISALALGSSALATPAVVNPVAIHPLISDWAYLGNSATPPSQAACNAVGRRCFDPAAMANSYNYASLHAPGDKGQGKTIAVVDSFGASTIRQDLATFNTAFGLTHLSGETGANDPAGRCQPPAGPP